ncbi:MAG: hypothetical protein U0990_07510 [Candidatus Nanopelagicales bacterium]|nr:hypothetical protein [Candidatus Nanopelagicales bacterium]MDZ4249921.1 hypothetical protein [Candidatus Nanopelagicales bacterium]
MTKKITVSLPDELVLEAQRAVEQGRADNVSAYVARAMSQQREDDTLTELVSQMRSSGGEPTPEDYAWASQVLGHPVTHPVTPAGEPLNAAS